MKAEPEADPAYLYRGYYGHPYAYAPWGFGYGYLRGFYGRSAYVSYIHTIILAIILPKSTK